MKMRAKSRPAFTLVELLVVMAIIALLLAALLPAFGVVRRNAKIAQTQSIFAGLNAGIESYRAEQSLGASLPPSTGDNTAQGQDRRLIATPPPLESIQPIRVAGANLLVLALLGDGLGTAGFKNVQGAPGWWDDTHKVQASNGLYSIDSTTGKEKFPRYGPYVDEKLSARVKGLDELAGKGGIVGPGDPAVIDFVRSRLPVFLDAWDRPILYYKASPGSIRMLPDGTTPGIYRQEDNSIITGSLGGGANITEDGLDFGSGKNSDYGDAYHAIAKAEGPNPDAPVQNLIDNPGNLLNSFSMFILDQKVKSRPTPVQKDSYLLISSGPDGIYGTADDVTNWTRETD